MRVGVGHALVNDPGLLLADESTGNLDSRTAAEIIDLLFALARAGNTTLLIATHDPALAGRCDSVLHLVDGRVAGGT